MVLKGLKTNHSSQFSCASSSLLKLLNPIYSPKCFHQLLKFFFQHLLLLYVGHLSPCLASNTSESESEVKIVVDDITVAADSVQTSLKRVKRQFQTKVDRKIPDLSGIEQGCKTTGYETREREICEEIVERVCLVNEISSNFLSTVINNYHLIV